ncbi:MAG TPA: preprotein translocase subunit SecE [Clostridiales bacterium]|nr:preprotein translocase subunit SecE [Clostridiales bacterium]
MAKKPNKKNKGQKAKNFNNSQKTVVAPDVKDDMVAEETVETAKVEETAEVKAEPVKEQKADKKSKKDGKSKKQNKKEPKVKSNKVKESVAELKKVTWPTFPKVVKNTILVLGIVLLFTIVLFGIDYGLSWIYKLLTPAA